MTPHTKKKTTIIIKNQNIHNNDRQPPQKNDNDKQAPQKTKTMTTPKKPTMTNPHKINK